MIAELIIPYKEVRPKSMVIIEILKGRYNSLKDSNLCFYKDRYQNEVDILLKYASQLKLVK